MGGDLGGAQGVPGGDVPCGAFGVLGQGLGLALLGQLVFLGLVAGGFEGGGVEGPAREVFGGQVFEGFAWGENSAGFLGQALHGAFEQSHGVGAGLDAQFAVVAAVLGVLSVSHQALEVEGEAAQLAGAVGAHPEG